MTWLLVAIVVFWGGVGFGIVMLVGVMVYEGRWTFPGTAAREVQRLRVRRALEEFEIESAHRKIELNRLYDEQIAIGAGYERRTG